MTANIRTPLTIITGSVLAGLIGLTGCGTEGSSEFSPGPDDQNGTPDNRDLTGGSFDNNGGGSSGSSGSSGNNGAGSVSNVSPGDACATSNAGTGLAPISLVFMIDRSGSMGGNANAVRWQPVVSGLQTFFGDAASQNIEASLSFFPIVQNNASVCTAPSYATQTVALTKLPNAAPFTAAFTATGPNGGTPTEPALQGAIDFAKTVKAQNKNVAIVLATDGAPNDCSSDVNGVSTIAGTGVTAGIKTYVIGVGPSTGNLNTIAAGGGTGTAIMIPTNNPAQVSADLIKAVGNIAASLLGCNYPLPTPPAGQTLDVNKVNVNYTAPGQPAKTLPYSADCSNKEGWHYDSPSTPKEIILCDNACNTAKATAGAKLDVIFGCQIAAPPGTELPGPK